MSEAKTGRQIRVSNEVFDELQKRGEAFTDSVDDVLRRILGLPKKEKHKREKEDQDETE